MIVGTLLSHYRRHPVQGLFLLAGIMVANVLLSGTLLINAQARASYEQGEQLLQSGPVARIESRDRRQPLPEREFIELRLKGFDQTAPVLRRTIQGPEGHALELLGVDVFAMSSQAPRDNASRSNQDSELFTGFAFEPFQLWAAPARARQLGWQEGQKISLENGRQLPPLTFVENSQLGHRMLLDIGVLQQLTNSSGQLSWIAVFEPNPSRLEELRQALPERLRLVPVTDAPDPAEMTRSFHLNLAAMGLLAFVVGVFLMYNALAFSYTDRRDLVRRMRLAGVDRNALRRGLLIELCLFLGVGSALGLWLGARLAAWLLPGVGQTLAQLYNVYIAYPDSLAPSGLLLPLAMTALAALLCVLIPQNELLNSPLLERWRTHREQLNLRLRDQKLLRVGSALLLLAAAITAVRPGLLVTLAGLACLLLGAALLLPRLLRFLLDVIQRMLPGNRPRLEWLVADSRWLLGPAALALMALTMALVANNGLNTMISSFRVATDQWLEQRLAADLFLQARGEPAELESFLNRSFDDLTLSERYRTEVNLPLPAEGSEPVEVVSLPSGGPYRNSVPLVRAVENAQSAFEASRGLYISERAWRIDGWQVDDKVMLCPGHEPFRVLGVYHDYGNPKSQFMLHRDLFQRCWPALAPISLAVHGPDGTDWPSVQSALAAFLDVEPQSIVDQNELKALGLSVFDRTFTVTQALNALTLLVAAIGIFCAVSAIHHHRVGQQALLASLGVSRRQRGVLLLAQWGLLGALCLVLVWPFGTLLAAYLAGVVTPTAFGWSFPLRIELAHYLQLTLWALISLFLAVLLPSFRLLKASPAALLKEQSL